MNETLQRALLTAYREQQDQLIVRRLRIACVLSIIIVPLALSMDWVEYRWLVPIFAVNRLGCCLVLGAVLVLLHNSRAPRQSHVLAQIWVQVMLGYNALMILLSDGVLSPYYAGINLVVLGACLLLPWTFEENFVACLASFLWYLAACAGHWWLDGPPPAGVIWIPTFFNNAFMTLSNVAICGTAGYFAAQLRFHDFRLQYELDQNKQALEESYHQLDDQKREVELSYQKLEEADRAKSQFFATISHELRTPLTLILSPLEGLRRHPALNSDGKMRQTVELMYENGLRLLALINDLLDLVRLDKRQFELHVEDVDLTPFLAGIASSMRGIAERSGLSLEHNLHPQPALAVRADKSGLEKVFINLLFNAIKFTPKPGTIRLLAGEEQDGVYVDVQDTGIGIAEEHLDKVFGRFWQEDGSATRARQGTGIGLALVKEIVELHGGQVSVTSKKGVGSTFRVRLPKSGAAAPGGRTDPQEDAWLTELYRKAQLKQGDFIAPDAAKSPTPESGGHRPTLLIVEDEPDMQQFLASELGATYSIILAADGQLGWELAHQRQPKLIITDQMLPKMDGITLCQRLRSSPSLLPTKIILLTARADDRTKLAALGAGADDFLTKPFSMVELKTRLANLLLTSQLERELQSQNLVLESTLRQLQAAEAQLVQNAHLSALGSMSAGIMHEINNPVNFLLTAAHYLRTCLPADSEEARTTVHDIETGLQRIRDIIADLRGFAYGGSSTSKKECDPEKILRTAKRFLASEIKADVVLEEKVDRSVPLFGSETQLIQLLVNILQNALQATEANATRGRQRIIQIRLAPEATCFLLSVRDNGCGIKEDVREKIFDPFFTTKEVGQGMGLGLSISHTIVKQHGGEIFVRSEWGEFTEFTIRLPLLADGITSVETPP